MATLFYLFGHAWHQWEETGTFFSRYDWLHWAWQLLIVLALCVMVNVIILIFGPTSMLSFRLHNAVPYMVAALCGSMMVVYVSRWLVARPGWLRNFLVFIGHHTFEVLTWHLLCFKLVNLLIIKLYGLDIECLAMCPVIDTEALRESGVDVEWSPWWWAYLLVGAGLPLLCQWVRLRKWT